MSDLALRDLASADEADSRWLMHKVEFWDKVSQENKATGNWRGDALAVGTGTSNASHSGSISRMCGIDIRVGMKVEEGMALIWHTQLEAGATPFDNTMYLRMWVRLLLKKI